MSENKEKQYEPYDASVFTITRSRLKRLEFESVFYGFPYGPPFFGFCLENDKPHPFADTQIKEWEEIHGPMPPLVIIEDLEEEEGK